MLDYMERTGKTGLHAVLATYRAYQNHLNYQFFREQMAKVGIKTPKDIQTLEHICAPKIETATVADLVAGYIGKRAAFDRCDLQQYIEMKRGGVNYVYLTKTIKLFRDSGKIERVGKGVYLSNAAA